MYSWFLEKRQKCLIKQSIHTMYKLHKSKSNPSKLHIFTPSYSGSKLAPQSSRQFTNRSASGGKKFGIRQMPLSPTSREKNSKQKDRPKISINNVNFNVVICNKEEPFASPINSLSSKNKYPQSMATKINFFKSNNILKTLHKFGQLQKRKKTESVIKFEFNPLKVLAKGQYGNLYLAYAKDTNFVVVLKSFHRQKVDINFMIDEFKIQLYCRHSNILPAYGFFFSKSEVYLIMEAGAHNLYHQIKQAGYFSQKKAATYIHQVLKGLAYLHLNRVIHRDIKPQNIIICGGVAKITDFGWSTITKNQRKTYCGTLDYVSPQVSAGVYYDNKIDCWCVGVLAYEMLTGFPPFDLSKTKKQRPTLNYKKPVFPSKISALGQNFINRMLAIDPEERPSAGEALRDPWIQNNSQQFKKRESLLKEHQHF